MTIHFIYAVPPVTSKLLLYYNNLVLKAGLLPPLHRYGIDSLIQWPHPIYAPYSITYHLLHALKKKYKVRLYDLREKGTCKLKDKDILLVHPWPDRSHFPWEAPDRSTVGYRAIKENLKNKIVVIAPYSNDVNQVGWLKEIFKLKNDIKFIPICGNYWMKNWEESPLKSILNKQNIFRVNMAIDSNEYPFIKKTFSPKNKRKFLYIGRSDYPKNTVALENIASNCKGFEGAYIGSGEIKGWKKISEFSNLNPEFVLDLAKEYDFFLSTSEADAQATTILEHMCMGFGIACTHESGYDYPGLIRLDVKDTAFNCAQIEKIQNMEEEYILDMTKKNRQIARQEHNWEKFSKEVLEFIYT